MALLTIVYVYAMRICMARRASRKKGPGAEASFGVLADISDKNIVQNGSDRIFWLFLLLSLSLSSYFFRETKRRKKDRRSIDEDVHEVIFEKVHIRVTKSTGRSYERTSFFFKVLTVHMG